MLEYQKAICGKCEKPVDSMESFRDIGYCATKILLKCHGEEQTICITDKILHGLFQSRASKITICEVFNGDNNYCLMVG